MLKQLWRMTVIALAAVFAAPNFAADRLRLELDVIEARCGSKHQSVEVCEELSAWLERHFTVDDVNAFNRKAIRRWTRQLVVPVGGTYEDEYRVIDGTLEIELSISPIQSEEVILGIKWSLTTNDDETQEGHTQSRSRIGGEAFVFSGVKSTTSDANGESISVVRLMSMRVSEAL